MKAAICTKYGDPQVIQLQEINKPYPKKNQILVKVKASTLNSGDITIRGLKASGLKRLTLRCIFGFFKPRKPILGTVFSGEVEKIGLDVKKFKVGDEVFGLTGFKFGAHAENLIISEEKLVSKKPVNATHNEAASILFGDQTAIYFLQKTKIQEKQNCKVLIIGGAGSVGSAAIQIAKYYKGIITIVCHSNDEHLIKQFKINAIIFYDKENFRKKNLSFDIVFDASGKFTKNQCLSLLKGKGVL